jgi:hypothetical protein
MNKLQLFTTSSECQKIENDLDALWQEWDEMSQIRDVGYQLDNEQEMLLRLIEDTREALADCRLCLRCD